MGRREMRRHALVLAGLLALVALPAGADPTPWQVEIQGGRYEVIRLNVTELPLPTGRFLYLIRSNVTGLAIGFYATYDEARRLCWVGDRITEWFCEEQR